MQYNTSSGKRDFGVSTGCQPAGDVGWWPMSKTGLDEFAETGTPDPGPEHRTKHELTQWLESHGGRVFWEEQNKWDHPTFTIKREGDSSGTPDLLILIDQKTVIAEYKTGSRVGQLYDAYPQLRGYWREYVECNLTYHAAGVSHRIDGFLTASQHSPKGRLFPQYAEKRQNYLDMDETRRGCFEWGQLPPAEFSSTQQHTRNLWRDVKEIAGENKATSSKTPNIGVLLSDVLETPSEDPAPALLWNAGSHNQAWEVLG